MHDCFRNKDFMVQESVGFLQALELYNTAVGPAEAVSLHQLACPCCLLSPLNSCCMAYNSGDRLKDPAKSAAQSGWTWMCHCEQMQNAAPDLSCRSQRPL